MNKNKIPYGISNFEQLRKENYLYIDKTKYIETLENDAPYQFFIRPRRFGKSLFLSMLENYYDVNKRNSFDEIFKDLYISKNPTPKKNSYLILRFDFSKLITKEGKERFIKSFDDCVINAGKLFLKKYSSYFDDEKLPTASTGAEMVMNFILYKTEQVNKKIFVLIDEYDNFANNLISGGNKELYYELLSGEGYVKTFYKTIKTGTSKSIERVFITGVSPIMLDDLTSGFNITINFTLEKKYNEMMGFTSYEVRKLINSLDVLNKFHKETLFNDMKSYYNGYLFSEDSETRIFNPNMVLYFLNAVINNEKYPKNMLDLNIKTDYKKLEELAFNFEDDETIEKLLNKEEISINLVEKFNLEYMYDKKENFISLLYYLGMLTIKESLLGDVILTIPNIAIETIYWEYFRDKLISKSDLKIDNKIIKSGIMQMALKGEMDLFVQYFKTFMSNISNRDLNRFDEKHIKIFLMSLFMNNIYIPNSEYEVENGFIDILLTKNKAFEDSIKYEWLIELKYIKESERNKFEQVKKEGINQIQRYSISEKLNKSFDMKHMKNVLIIVIGKKDIYVEVI
ncbi:AAA family ATPase (plasmid) [Haloimpatiens sp. FM7330]|uniref:AAA family ATPase n=1 Tax=Haloimpatiens sp. FM7330 TaxID=3298610 RepID=UPI003645ED67